MTLHSLFAVGAVFAIGLQIQWDDGDSGHRTSGSPFRLHNFDAPETWRAECPEERTAGYRAKALAETITEGRRVRETRYWYKDRFGRRVVDLSVDGQDLASELEKAGAGKKYDHDANEPPPDWCALQSR